MPPLATTLVKSDIESPADLPLGQVLAVTEIIDCWSTEDVIRHGLTELEESFGNFAPGRYGLLTRGVRRLREPIPMRGALGIWRMPQLITEAHLL